MGAGPFFMPVSLRLACAYDRAMPLPMLILLFAATVAAMEGFAYVMHRWIMHGPGWVLHASHHRSRLGRWELNDVYFLIFAAPAILLLWGGVQANWGSWAVAVGAGITAYGALYLGFHDILVHQRVPHRLVARSPYLKHIVQAHRLHHAVESKDGTVSFGFLVAPRPAVLKAALARREKAGFREPRRP